MVSIAGHHLEVGTYSQVLSLGVNTGQLIGVVFVAIEAVCKTCGCSSTNKCNWHPFCC
jgi:hypothetical protein